MQLLPVLVHPDPRLRQVAKPVTEFNTDLATLVENMAHTMYHENGIGLAAIQVGIPLRVLVIDLSKDRETLQTFINPEVQSQAETQSVEEGCLSVPGFFEKVNRAQTIQVSAFDVHGKSFTKSASGLEAACILHEIDHLDGKLFVDYLSLLKQSRIRRKLMKIKAAA